MSPQLILIAGPYRSGTQGDPERIALNLKRLEQAVLRVDRRGHVAMIDACRCPGGVPVGG